MNGHLAAFGVRMASTRASEGDLSKLGFHDKGGVFGQLTRVGSEQLRAFGEQLGRYVQSAGLIGSGSDVPGVFAAATQFRRTVLSVASVLAGYNAVVLSREAAAAMVTPVVVKTAYADEFLFVNGSLCPAMQRRYRAIVASPSFEAYLANGKEQTHAELKAALAGLVSAAQAEGVVTADKPRIGDLFDHVVCGLAHGDELASFGLTSEAQWDVLRDRVWRKWAMPYADRAVARLAIGRLLGDLQSNMAGVVRSTVSSTPSPCVFIYGGHDSTLVPLMRALGVDADAWPGYGAHIIVELFRGADTHRYWVRVSYNGVPQRVLGADAALIAWDEFSARLAPVVPANFALECSAADDADALPSKL